MTGFIPCITLARILIGLEVALLAVLPIKFRILKTGVIRRLLECYSTLYLPPET